MKEKIRVKFGMRLLTSGSYLVLVLDTYRKLTISGYRWHE